MAGKKHFCPFWTLYVTCQSEVSVARVGSAALSGAHVRIDPRLRMSCGRLLKTRHVPRKPPAPPNHQGGES